MQASRVPEVGFIDSTAGVRLESTVWNSAPRTSTRAGVVVVLTHQYSLLGGCQDLMQGIAKRISAEGIPCVTFNMRGVGSSTGRSTLTGNAEIADVAAVCRWAVEHFNSDVCLVGSSAGAPIAGSAVDVVPAVKGYVGIGYTFGYLAAVLFGRHFHRIINSHKPKLFIMGTKDGFTSVQRLAAIVNRCQGTTKHILVPDVGHFELEGSAYDQLMSQHIIEFLNNLGSRRSHDSVPGGHVAP